jgi:hypothetical protein
MTQQEFDNYGFRAGMFCTYQAEKYHIVSCCFTERLFGLMEDGRFPIDESNLIWVRCESVELLP